jgi:hypothetical protein
MRRFPAGKFSIFDKSIFSHLPVPGYSQKLYCEAKNNALLSQQFLTELEMKLLVQVRGTRGDNRGNRRRGKRGKTGLR